MKPFALLTLMAASLGLAGCSTFSKDPTPAQLASACQIVKCVCTPVRESAFSFSKRTPIDPLWGPDGKAYCPEKHTLERKDAPSMYDRPLY